MSRIGRRPVTVPAGVTLTVAGSTVTVKGPKGELERTLSPELGYKVEGAEFTVTRPSEAESTRRCTASAARWSPTWSRA